MNPGRKTDPSRDIARTIYIECGKTLSELAALTGETEEQLLVWIKEGAWDMQRRSLATSRKKQLDQLYEALELLQQQEDPDLSVFSKKLDIMLKFTTAIKNLDADGSVYGMVEGVQQFISWLYQRDKDTAQKFTRLFDEYFKTHAAA